MQTQFDPAQLADPDIAEADAILRKCVHCGFCLPACPTYALLGDERDSPRGRIYLIKNMLESGAEAGPAATTHIDRCLSCLSCRTACPSGVDYMRLIDLARVRVQAAARRGRFEQAARWAAAHVFSQSRLFAAGLALGRRLRWLRPLLSPPLRSALDRVPARKPTVSPVAAGCYPAAGAASARVILARGCVQPSLRPEIDQAAIRLLNRAGVEVMVPETGGCCGAIPYHLGRREHARRLAAENIAAWRAIEHGGPVDAVISTTGGCGVTLADYGHLLGADSQMAEDAGRFAAKTSDIAVFLASRPWPQLTFAPPEELTVAYHAACSLRHGQGIKSQPADLLEKAGFIVREPAEAHFCCGSAGTYSLFQTEIATALGQRKAEAVAACRADILAAGNIGCLDQLAAWLDIPTVHTVELLDWASGGQRPIALDHHRMEPS